MLLCDWTQQEWAALQRKVNSGVGEIKADSVPIGKENSTTVPKKRGGWGGWGEEKRQVWPWYSDSASSSVIAR